MYADERASRKRLGTVFEEEKVPLFPASAIRMLYTRFEALSEN